MSDRKILASAALVLVAALAVIAYYRWEASQRMTVDTAELAVMELEPAGAKVEVTRPVDLFLFSPSAGKPGKTPLTQTTRELPVVEGDALMVQQIVTAVLRESGDVLPPTARVLQTYLLDDGTVVVDLSREVAEQLNGGASSELAVLRSMTRSIRENLRSAQRVRFLVDGQQRPTLSGHISLHNPFM